MNVSREVMVISRKMEMRPSLVTVALAAAAALWPCGGGSGLNTLPDASQEGLLSQGRLEETAFDDMEGKEERLIYKCGYTSETVVK